MVSRERLAELWKMRTERRVGKGGDGFMSAQVLASVVCILLAVWK